MVILKSFYEDSSSLSVVNQFVYEKLVPKLEDNTQPSEAIFHDICDFMSWTIEHGHTGNQIGLDVFLTLVNKYLPGLTDFLQEAPVTQVDPIPSEFPFDEFILSKL